MLYNREKGKKASYPLTFFYWTNSKIKEKQSLSVKKKKNRNRQKSSKIVSFWSQKSPKRSGEPISIGQKFSRELFNICVSKFIEGRTITTQIGE